jgi:putative peptide zinc metalloprotease protein
VADPFFSSSWYRVAHLVPGLRPHVVFHRHIYRGRIWYVLEDRASRRCHRLTPAAYQIAGLIDGQRTIQQIWEAASDALGDEAPSQDETIRMLGLLHFADALQCDVTPDTLEVLRRCQRREQADGWQRYLNPLSLRIPLFDPDAWLTRLEPQLRRLFRWPFALTAALAILAGALVAGRHWQALTTDAADRLLDPGNLLLMWIAYPLMKALHELGHAVAVKAFGGSVPEMGIQFLVMMPIPYVDASSASVWPEKWRRVVVGAAGIGVELLLASGALLVWASTDPGWLRNLAFNVAWIGAASSLLVNGNPLLRFDGYYLLSDAIEIPNLRRRASAYLSYLTLRHAFRVQAVRNPVSEPGEARWFLAFGVASFLYRIYLSFAIAYFLSERFFLLGVLLAGFALVTQIALPLARGLRFVTSSPRLGDRRGRAVGLTAATLAALAILTLALPLPLHTVAQGVVWPPEGAQVRVQTDGFVVALLVEPGTPVQAGQALVRTRDPILETELAIESARLRALQARHHAERFSDRVRAQITADEIQTTRASLARARERVGEVVIRSPMDGAFVAPGWADLEGRFVKQGQLIGYVVGESIATARVVIPQADAALVHEGIEGIEVRSVSTPARTWPARIRRDLPGSGRRLPSAALGTAGGGPIPTALDDPAGLTPLASIFQVELELPPDADAGDIGTRVYVRFDHGSEPIAMRALRSVQRLLLGRARA